MEEKKHQGPIIMLVLLRIALTLFYIGFILNTFFSSGVAAFAFLIAIGTYILFPKKLHAIYYKIEGHFISHYYIGTGYNYSYFFFLQKSG